jgi:hypothetical protein
MLKRGIKYALGLMVFISVANAQDATISVDANLNKRAVSPYIYGLNNDYDKPAQFYKDAGVRFSRMNQGNNATKYNWRKKISSHPDWYNNVYANDWDAKSKKFAQNNPDMQVMFAFQLLGRVASSTAYNFDDWAFNSSKWWNGVNQNLTGSGVPDTVKVFKDNKWQHVSKAKVEGDVNLYTQEWPADSTVAILKHWFGEGGLGLNKNQFLYWSMDNEADIWDGTHDDVMPNGLLPASEFMDKYIDVAKKAKALFPEIKLCGPVTTSEWQWFKWGSESIRVNGVYYTWFEYFIKRCADEEKASGLRVLDVFDIHHYPWASNDAGALQNHRSFFDKTYIYPGANGVKTINGGWDESQNKIYIFQRVNDWLNKHFGANHGITLGLSEWHTGVSNPNLASVIYASTLGVFANNGVDFFTPWSWNVGMWETLHLFSRYSKGFSVSSTSSLENTVSAYTTVNDAADSMTVIIVNRDRTAAKNVTVNLSNFAAANGSYKTLQLASLPAGETFKSHSNNALKTNSVVVNENSFTISVPALSTTAVLIDARPVGVNDLKNRSHEIKIYPNPANELLSIEIDSHDEGPIQIHAIDTQGRTVKVFDTLFDGHSNIKLDVASLKPGFYFLSVKSSQFNSVKSFVVKR